MANNDMAVISSDIADPDMQKSLHERLPCNPEDDKELQNALKVSSEVVMSLAYSSEKLANLESLFLHVLAPETDIEARNFENDNISTEFIEEAFAYDILYALLDFELRELENLMADLEDLTADALNKISSCKYSMEFLRMLAGKLHDSENVLKQSQERVLVIKLKLAKLQMSSFIFKQNDYKHRQDMGVRQLCLAATGWKPQKLTVEKRRLLRMLEISLARELELEKKLTEIKQNEEDLKSKICLREQVAVGMEEAAEGAWARFLEADNRAEVLMGISKEMQGKLKSYESSLTNPSKREEELKSKLQDCIKQLNEKEISIQKLNSSISQLVVDNAEVTTLRERVSILERRLIETESRLMEANASSERSQQQLKEMEDDIGSLRDNMDAAESRAGNAEEKVTHLTDSNVELTEELDFLKGSNESITKKVSLLEKQLRELDIQLQHARASSEASQEQQTMLYTAIWDMETLIDELKQKLAIAESKTEIAEEQCIILSETNSDLNKDLDHLRSRMEFMETSLDKATLHKRSSAKDISFRTSLIMDMVMQLTMERERIQKQLTSLTNENKLLREKLWRERNPSRKIMKENKIYDEEFQSSGLDSADAKCVQTSPANPTEISSEILEVEKPSMNASLDEIVTGSSSSADHTSNSIPKLEVKSLVKTRKSQKMYIFVSILALLVPILAAHLFHNKLAGPHTG